MSIERVFLGWESPALPRAAAWLRERYASGGTWDLGGVVIVTPGARAGRRLLEVLVEAAGDLILLPPRMITPGDLPEQLYREPGAVVVNDLRRTLARTHMLREADEELVKRIVPAPPDPGNIREWWNLARDLERVYDAAAAGAVEPHEVPTLCRNVLDFRDEERWDALDRLGRAYHSALAEHGLKDHHAARLDALNTGRCAAERDIVLLCTADLDRLPARMLRQAAEAASPTSGGIISLVHAPESEAAGFDDMGCLLVDYWQDRLIDLDPEAVRIVDRPRDQAYETLRLLETFGGRFAADQVTVGIGDEEMSPIIERTLEIAGIPARTAVAREVSRTAPVMLLGALAGFLGSERFDDFAALLRHPDIEEYLIALSREQTSARPADASDIFGGWLTLLDRYITAHLQGRLSERWLGEPATTARLKHVWEAIRALAPADHQTPRPLPAWAPVITDALQRIYGRRELSRHDSSDRLLLLALQKVADAIREQADLDPGYAFIPRVTLADAVALLISRVAGASIPPASTGPAVELLGWLELQLDDAPALIVTGVNEGHIPESVRADAFLPDRARRCLGLMDNRRRFARDKYAMIAILHSREAVRLISGRRGGDDHPLTPSRLLLACPPEELPERVLRFYGPKHGEAAAPPVVLQAGKASRFIVPPPRPLPEPITTLRVTAFRDYLRCPYRFYLQHVLDLETLDDRAVELDAASFGNLAHGVLEAFGKSELAASTDAAAIEEFVLNELGAAIRYKHGPDPGAAVTIQAEQLRDRLRSFARWQAGEATRGWRILAQERRVTAEIGVDGVPFTVTGQIDRIDVHESGRFRIADYKTGDAATDPIKVHVSGGDWVDLQLPLYRVLAASLELPGTRGEPELGFIQLPKDLSRVGFVEAAWSPADLGAAIEVAREVIRGVRAGNFWPPKYPVEFMEDFAGICLDGCDREGAIEEGDRLAEQRVEAGR